MYKKTKSIFVTFLILTIFSCEYKFSEENFRDLDPPDETPSFDLSLTPEGDTIEVYSNTEFQYNLNTYGRNIKNARFILDNSYWRVESAIGSFTIIADRYEEGYYTLSLEMQTNSGSGSIADYLGAEDYLIEKHWVLLIDDTPDLAPTKSITEEGFLKITWPKWNEYNFHSYEFHASINDRAFDRIIFDIDSVTYIDSLYIGGHAYFEVIYISIANGELNQTRVGLSFDEEAPELQFENIGIDSLRIFWNKSLYKAKYTLDKDYSLDSYIIEGTTDTSFIVTQVEFGKSSSFQLYTTPYYLNTLDTRDTQKDSKTYYIGLKIAGNWPWFGYNHMDGALYTNTYDAIECYDISAMTLLKGLDIENLSYQGLYSCPTNSTKIAALSSNSIYIFPDKNLQDPIRIPYDSWGENINYFYLTDNDYIAIAQPNKYVLINTEDLNDTLTIQIDDYPVYSIWSCITTSKDGKYTCFVTENGINIYNIESGIANLTYSDSRSYCSAMFNINDPSQLFLTFWDNSALEIRNISDFSLLNTIDLEDHSIVLRNIDPASGNLLLMDYHKFYIMDVENSNLILKLNSGDYRPYLFGNWLFSHSGYALDISEYLNQ